ADVFFVTVVIAIIVLVAVAVAVAIGNVSWQIVRSSLGRYSPDAKKIWHDLAKAISYDPTRQLAATCREIACPASQAGQEVSAEGKHGSSTSGAAEQSQRAPNPEGSRCSGSSDSLSRG
ncbi:unnamed protein product, partial [Protopolystoma xenopodis]